MRYVRGFCYLLAFTAIVLFLVVRATRTRIWYARVDLVEGSTRVKDLFRGYADCFPDCGRMPFENRVEMLKAKEFQERAALALAEVKGVDGGLLFATESKAGPLSGFIDRRYGVEKIAKTSLVRITVHADSPEKAVALANALCDAAILENQELDYRILDEAKVAARKYLGKPGGDPELRARLERFLKAAEACADRTLKPLDRYKAKPLEPGDAWEAP